MKSKVRNIFWLSCAAVLILWIPLLWANRQPTEVDLPLLTQEELTATEEAHQQAAREHALATAKRKIFSCESDEDCIIVDKDLCGCLVGPQGVVAINAAYTTDFDRIYRGKGTATCPDKEPSQERECSPSAQAVCKAKTCKITY